VGKNHAKDHSIETRHFRVGSQSDAPAECQVPARFVVNAFTFKLTHYPIMQE
jgi:hypothetical protein